MVNHKDRIKVLYILHSTIMAGSTIVLLNLLKELTARDCVKSVIVVPDGGNDHFKEKISELGIKMYVAPIVSSVYPFCLGGFQMTQSIGYLRKIHGMVVMKRKSLSALQEIVERERPDIIHTNTGVVQEGFFCAQKNHIPHVWHIRVYQRKDFNWIPFPSFRQLKSLLRQSNVITITDDLTGEYDLLGYDCRKTIYDGVFHKSDTHLDYPKEKFFLCASRVSAEKNIKDVVLAFASFYKENTNFKLVLLGFGPEEYKRELVEISEKYNCKNAVEFKGYVTNVQDYMRKATALVVASNYEGFGLMTAEAAFSGCLIIGRNTGGTKEILKETGGLLFNSTTELQERMHEVAGMSDAEYMKITKKAQGRAVSLFSIEHSADAVSEMYRQMLA